jgi:mannose/fructose/N-acetylgalactosamine-specific phosphotransferase system component IIC
MTAPSPLRKSVGRREGGSVQTVAPHDQPSPVRAHHFLATTLLGKWAVGFAVGAFLLQFAWMILPGGAALSMAFALAGGISALIAIVHQRDRAIAVYIAVVPLVMTVLFLAAELLIGHD